MGMFRETDILYMFCKCFVEQIFVVDSSGATKVIDRKPRGPPTSLGKYEKEVVDYIQSLRLSGGVVNRPIVIVTARGIVINKENLLSDFDGPIDLSKSWAQSFLRRLGYVKGKGTKAARKVPDDLEFIQMELLSEIQKLVKTYDIPDDLTINFDQTNVMIIL